MLVWRDLNQNGISETGELFSLTDLGITSISLTSTPVGSVVAGNLIFEQASYNGRLGPGGGTIAEVFLGFAERGDPQALGAEGGPAAGEWTLPDSRGYGMLASWSRTAATNPEFRTALEALATLPLADLDRARSLTETMLFAWAGATNIAATARGDAFDARRLVTMEKLFGQAFVDAQGATNPNARTAPLLQQSWDVLVGLFEERALALGALHELFPDAVYDFVSDSIDWSVDFAELLPRLDALPDEVLLRVVTALAPILTAHEAEFGLIPGQAAREIALLSASYKSEDALFARYLAEFVGGRTNVDYPAGVMPLNLPTGQAIIGTGAGDSITTYPGAAGGTR